MSGDRSAAGLVARARNGDQQAWDELVERYAPLVWRLAAAGEPAGQGYPGHLFSERRPDLGVGGYVPQPGRAVAAYGGQGLTVGADGYRVHPAAERRADLGMGGQVPQPGSAVPSRPGAGSCA